MPFTKMSYLAHYAPDQIVTNDDLKSVMDTTDEWIKSRTGIEQRHISKNENTSDLAIHVAKDLLEQSGYDAKEIDFIILTTISPDSVMPSTAAKVQSAVGASNAFAFDLTAACSGFVFALAMADKLISSGAYKKGMVIGAETLSKHLDWSDRSTAVLFGDGSGGVIVEADSEKHFLLESLHTDGSRGDSLTSGAQSLSSPFSESTEVNPFIQMDGRAIFDFAIREVSKSIAQLIEDSEMDKDKIDFVILHQANRRILDKMAHKIGLPREKFLENMMTYGNTSAASIPILMSEAAQKGQLKLDGSQTVILSGFGGGLTWGSLIVKI